MRFFLTTLCMAMIPFANAEVPHEFSAGTAAKASEVNENFNALDADVTLANQQIEELGLRVDTVEETLNNSEEETIGLPHEISHDYVPGTIGALLEYSDNKYRLIRMPFLEFVTGDRYAVTYPAQLRDYYNYDGSYDYSVIWNSLETNHIKDAKACSGQKQITINNHEVWLSFYDARQLHTTYYDYQEDSYDSTEWEVNNSYFVDVCFKINETMVRIPWINLEQTELLQQDIVAANDFDLVDNIDWSLLGHDDALINAVDDLIDYIHIEKLTQ